MSDAVSFRPMTAADIETVLKIEYAAFSHPWTRGIFTDALTAVLLDNLVLDPREDLGVDHDSFGPRRYPKGRVLHVLRLLPEDRRQELLLRRKFCLALRSDLAD